MRHVLTNVIGAREQADVHVNEFDLAGGEMLLLCSDGLHGVLEDSALVGLIGNGGTPSEIAPRLVEAALDRGGKDNVTALLARYEGV
jgi:protein phosphatase